MKNAMRKKSLLSSCVVYGAQPILEHNSTLGPLQLVTKTNLMGFENYQLILKKVICKGVSKKTSLLNFTQHGGNHPALEMKAKGFCTSQEGNFLVRINIESIKIELECLCAS